jgi:polyisoprenoid-binding protein YceI
MELPRGTHTFGPGNGALWIKTGRTGAAAAAGHDLVIRVTSWEATLEVGENPSQTRIALDVDSTSLRVHEGVGGMQELGDEDKENIRQTIDDEVLQGRKIRFRSTSIESADDGRLRVEGELTLLGNTRPLTLEVVAGEDGRLTGSAVVKQTDWGMAPYAALYGALKVVDEVEVVLTVSLGATEPGDTAETPELPVPWDLSWRARPLVDPRLSSTVWALVFFLYLWLGLAAVGVSLLVALLPALVAAGAIFLFVRSRGVGRVDQSL